MSNETKKVESELSPDELEGVSGGAVPPGPPNARPGLGIKIGLAEPPEPGKPFLQAPPEPDKIGH